MCFFSPTSVNESPLSLRRFKFTEKSIDSFSLFFHYFFFVVVDDDDDLAVVVVVVAMLTVVAVVGYFMICFSVVVDGFYESFFFLFTSPLRPGSSPLLCRGFFPVSVFGLSFVSASVFVVAAAAAIVVVVVFCCSCCRRSCCFSGLLRAGF